MRIEKYLVNAGKGILVLSLLVAAPLTASAEFPYFNRPQNAADLTPRPDRATSRSDTDMYLIEQVNNALEPYEHINVDAEKGIVTLTGKVNSLAQRETVISRTREVPGVTDVNSLVIVEDY